MEMDMDKEQDDIKTDYIDIRLQMALKDCMQRNLDRAKKDCDTLDSLSAKEWAVVDSLLTNLCMDEYESNMVSYAFGFEDGLRAARKMFTASPEWPKKLRDAMLQIMKDNDQQEEK